MDDLGPVEMLGPDLHDEHGAALLPFGEAVPNRLLKTGGTLAADGRENGIGKGVGHSEIRMAMVEALQTIVTPPSTTMVWPVMKLEASEARKRATGAISSG